MTKENDEDLLLQIMRAPGLAERVDAARQAGIMPPVGVEPPQTRIVMRMVRTPDGKWWGALEGAESGRHLSEIVTDDFTEMIAVLGAALNLIATPLMHDGEHSDYLRFLDKMGAN